MKQRKVEICISDPQDSAKEKYQNIEQNYKPMKILKEHIKSTWKLDPEDITCEQ